MTILITGCAGFIGSHTAEKLLNKTKHQIIGVDNFDPYYPVESKKRNLKNFINHPRFIFFQTDITHQSSLARIFKKNQIDKVIHLAAKAGVRNSIKFPQIYEKVNIGGTINLLQLSSQHLVKQFIYGSSSSVYGNSTKTPFRETNPCDKPISPYAASKRAAELMCYNFHHLYQLPITILRFFTVYGPRSRPDMAPYLFTKALLHNRSIIQFGDGSMLRDYTYIDDIVAGIVQALKKPFDFEIINLGSNRPVRLNKFIKRLEKITKKKAEIKQTPAEKGDVETTFADIKKARRLLDWEPKNSLEESLQKFVAWLKKQPV